MVVGHCTNIRGEQRGDNPFGRIADHLLLGKAHESSSLRPSSLAVASRLCSPNFGAGRALAASNAEKQRPDCRDTGRFPRLAGGSGQTRRAHADADPEAPVSGWRPAAAVTPASWSRCGTASIWSCWRVHEVISSCSCSWCRKRPSTSPKRPVFHSGRSTGVAERFPLGIVPDCDGEPVVLALAAVNALRRVPFRCG